MDQAEVERLAYALWEQEGRLAGTADKNYFEAERLLHERATQLLSNGRSATKVSPATVSKAPRRRRTRSPNS